VIEGDFQASNWLDLQRLHHNRLEHALLADEPRKQLPDDKPGDRHFRGGDRSRAFQELVSRFDDFARLVRVPGSGIGKNALFKSGGEACRFRLSLLERGGSQTSVRAILSCRVGVVRKCRTAHRSATAKASNPWSTPQSLNTALR
jgi:hypothetical protein